MSLDYPVGLRARQVKYWDKGHKSIFAQERILLDNPEAIIREYTYSGTGNPMSVVKTLILETTVECSVPDLLDEQVANGGGLILPTDRFMSFYDFNPSILSEVEWRGAIYSIQSKEYIERSGRCDLKIRTHQRLKGVVYHRVTSESFDQATWGASITFEELVLAANRDAMNIEESIIFSGVAGAGDTVFWMLKENLKLSNGTVFVPSLRDQVIDVDYLGNREVYQVIAYRLNSEEQFYRLLCRRFTEIA